MKPGAKVYDAMEKLCVRTGADIIYLDDRLENVQAGLARGWRSFLHETPDKTRAFLEECLSYRRLGRVPQFIRLE